MKFVTLSVALLATSVLAGCDIPTEESIAYNARVSALNLSPDELRIWQDLTPAQQERAILFIENGGTLISSLGDK
jgi:hypothetical protein